MSLRRSRIVLSVSVFVLVLFAGTAATLLLRARAEVAPHLTRAGLLSVRPGMSHTELVRSIGRPLFVTPSASAGAGATPMSNDLPAEQTWIYARPGLLDRLEVAVMLANGVVSSVNVEYDDATVYTTERGHRASLALPLEQLLE